MRQYTSIRLIVLIMVFAIVNAVKSDVIQIPTYGGIFAPMPTLDVDPKSPTYKTLNAARQANLRALQEAHNTCRPQESYGLYSSQGAEHMQAICETEDGYKLSHLYVGSRGKVKMPTPGNCNVKEVNHTHPMDTSLEYEKGNSVIYTTQLGLSPEDKQYSAQHGVSVGALDCHSGIVLGINPDGDEYRVDPKDNWGNPAKIPLDGTISTSPVEVPLFDNKVWVAPHDYTKDSMQEPKADGEVTRTRTLQQLAGSEGTLVETDHPKDILHSFADLLETGEEIVEVREDMREDRRERKEKERAERERKAAEEERLRQQQIEEQRRKAQSEQKKSDKKLDKTTSRETPKSTATSQPKPAQTTATPTQPNQTTPTTTQPNQNASASFDMSKMTSIYEKRMAVLKEVYALPEGETASAAQRQQVNDYLVEYKAELARLEKLIDNGPKNNTWFNYGLELNIKSDAQMTLMSRMVQRCRNAGKL